MFDVESLIQRILADIRERSVAPSGRDERRRTGRKRCTGTNRSSKRRPS